MTDKIENNNNFQNYVELTDNQIFNKIKEDLNPIQENLAAKKITVEEARSELKKINERLQGSKLEKKEKKEIGKAFEKLIKLEKNIDENALKDEVDGIINLLEELTKKDLANLKRGIQQSKQRRNPERTPEVQKGISLASDNLNQTIDDALNDNNGFIRKFIGPALKYFNS